MLNKLFKPFYALVVAASIIIILFYLKESSFNIKLEYIPIIFITLLIEGLGFYNPKNSFVGTITFSLVIFIIIIFGPLLAILSNTVSFIVPPIVNDIRNKTEIKFSQRITRIIFNISQGIIIVFIGDRLINLLNFDVKNTLDIWKITLVVLAYCYTNAIMITLILSFIKNKFIDDLISFNKNYYTILYTILLTPVLTYNFYDRGYIGLALILIIVYSMNKSIQVYKKWKEQEEKIFKDELTGAYNYRYFNSIIDSNITSKKEFALIIIDIDNFKNINDTYGHIVGDYVLKNLAKIMLESVKEEVICRQGGDEFSVILHSPKNTFDSACNILNSINESSIKYKDNFLKVNASLGYCLYKGENITKEELIDKADKAMYKAKNSDSKVKICEAM